MLFIVSSPSGAGKSTLCNHLIKNNKSLSYSISVTTRVKRDYEIEGVHYYFKTINEYKKMLKNKEFIETTQFNGNHYGSLESEVKEILQNNKNVLFDIDINGFKAIKQSNFKKIIGVFILPPSLNELRSRLINRNTENPDTIYKRLQIAKSEMKESNIFDHVIINDDLSVAKEKINQIYISELQK